MSYEDEVRRRSVGRFMALILMSLCSLASCSGESIQLERWEVFSGLSNNYSVHYFEGRSLSDAEVDRLDGLFESGDAGPEELYRLVGHAQVSRNRQRNNQLTLKLIADFPEETTGSFAHIIGTTSREGERVRSEVGRLWELHLTDDPENLALIRNAAQSQFFYYDDSAGQLLERGESLAPEDPYWPYQLGKWYLQREHPRNDGDDELLSQALGAFDRALQRIAALGLEPPQRVWLGIAKTSLKRGDFDRATEASRNTLTAVERQVSDKPGRRDDQAWHSAHTILGLAAVERGRHSIAGDHLLESARIEGAPTLGSFGPNMRLAEKLLAEGHKSTVLEYFELCGEFWKRPELDEWEAAVRAGISPAFYTNLVYGL